MNVYAKIERQRDPVSGGLTYVVWTKRSDELRRWPGFDGRYVTRELADEAIVRSGQIKVTRWVDAELAEERRNREHEEQSRVNALVQSAFLYHLENGTWD